MEPPLRAVTALLVGSLSSLVRGLAGYSSRYIFNPYTDSGDGAYPMARVIFGPDGDLYGTTVAGGGSGCYGSGCGVVFKLKRLGPPRAAWARWKETVLYRFGGGNDGAHPTTEVVFDKAGNLYGTTNSGGRTD